MKAAIYCRLSEEDRNKKSEEDDSESIQNQKSMLISYAMQRKWEVYKIYSDDDYTGSDRNRPGFNKLLHDAETHEFDVILCKTQSRFTRELELVEKYIHGLFPIWGIRFVSIVDNADTEIKGNKKARQINGLINEWYLEDMSESIKSVLTDKRLNGNHIGAFALYGYKKDPNKKGHLIVDEEAAEIVRKVFTLFSQGYGKTAIARILNDSGIPNPTEYKRLKGLRYQQPSRFQSTLWKYSAISDMLVNEIYIGNMVQGKFTSVSYKTKQTRSVPSQNWIRVENTHQAIINSDLWDQVKTIIKQRRKPCYNGKVGIFAKKVKCLHCGYTLHSSKTHSGQYLRCPNREISKDACIGSMISTLRLEKIILTEIRSFIKNYMDKELLEQNVSFYTGVKDQKDKLYNEVLSHQKRMEILSNGIKNLYIDKTKGLIDDMEFIDLSKGFHDDKKRLAKTIESNKREMERLSNIIENTESRRSLLESYINIEAINREMVEILIDYIEIGSRYEKSRERPVVIHWSF